MDDSRSPSLLLVLIAIIIVIPASNNVTKISGIEITDRVLEKAELGLGNWGRLRVL